MKKYELKKEIISIAHYMLLNKTPIRETAEIFGVSKSCIHRRLHKLKDIDEDLYYKITELLINNKMTGQYKGGKQAIQIVRQKIKNEQKKILIIQKELIERNKEDMVKRRENNLKSGTRYSIQDIINLANNFLESDLSLAKFASQYNIDPTSISRQFKNGKLEQVDEELYQKVIAKLNKNLPCCQKNKPKSNLEKQREYARHIRELQEQLRNKDRNK